MSEEEKPVTETQTEKQTEPETGASEIDNAAIRNSKLFSAVTRKLKAAEEALAAREQSEREARAQAEQRALEEKGEYTTLLQRKDEEHAARIRQLEKQILTTELKSQLVSAGMTDALTLTGAIHGFSGTPDDIAIYVEKLKEENAHHFGIVEEKGGKPGPIHGSPGARSTNSWAQIKADLHGRDPAKAIAADEAVREYFQKHNKMPF